MEFLEQGRAILWSKMKGYRHPLDYLHEVNRALADQFKKLCGQLEHLVMSSQPEHITSLIGMVDPTFEAKMQQHRILSEEQDTVLRQI